MADISTINGNNLKDTTARGDIEKITSGTLVVGHAQVADNAEHADNADNALKDGDGNIISSTYIKTLPTASSTVKGGIKTGYSGSGNYRAVAMSGENAYVYIPTVTTSAVGLMSAADKTKLNGLTGAGTWSVQTVTSNYWKSTSGTNTVKGTITAFINQTQKLCYLTGIVIVSGTTKDWDIIPISRLYSLFTAFQGSTTASSSMPGDSIVGRASFHPSSGAWGSGNGFGGYVRLNSDRTALQFGRVYTTSGSLGEWEFGTFSNEGVSFDAMLIMA